MINIRIRKTRLVIGVTAFVIATAAVMSNLLPGAGRQAPEPFDVFQKGSQRFAIRVSAYIEDGSWVGSGANYVFEARAVGSDEWRRIMVFRHDDAVKIPREQIRFLNDNIAYAFMGWMFAVTTDGGSTWSVWDATTDLRGHECCMYQYIQSVELTLDGNGTMNVTPNARYGLQAPRLFTKDYGRSWSAPNDAEILPPLGEWKYHPNRKDG